MRNILNIERLARLIKDKRAGRGLRDVSEEIGDVSPSTLSRVENGRAPDMETFLKLCDWLQIPAAELLVVIDPANQGIPSGENTGKPIVPQPTPESVALQLRADKNLDEATANALAEVVRAVYRSQSKTENEEKTS